MHWSMRIKLTRNQLGAHELIVRIEAGLSGVVTFTGHEISESECHLFFKAERPRAFKVAEIVRSRYIYPDESVTVGAEPSGKTGFLKNGSRFKIGDVLSIPLKTGSLGYGQFLGYIHDMRADAVRILDLVTAVQEVDPQICLRPGDRFPPVLTLLNVASGKFGWQVVGNASLEPRVLMFRHSNSGFVSGPGVSNDWRLWDSAGGWRDLGVLPLELRKVECAVTWSPWAIAERILTGRHLYEGCV